MPALFEDFFETHNRGPLGESARFFQEPGAWAARPQGCNGVSEPTLRKVVSSSATFLAEGPALPPPALGANVPLPGDGEDRGAAASDAARTPVQEEMEAEPAPPPAAGPSTEFKDDRKQDTLASEDRLKARLGQTQTNTHQAVESSDAALREGLGEVQAKYRWLWRTSWRPTTFAVMAVLSQPVY